MKLKCSFKEHYFQHGTFKRKMYACFVTVAKIVKRGTTIRAFKGAHLPGKRDENVKAIVFENCDLSYFPRGLHVIFHQLRALHIVNCGLTTMIRDDLIGLKALDILYIHKNRLKSLPADLLKSMSKLKVIVFTENKIKFMNSGILKSINVNDIKLINFQGNKSIDVYYGSERPGRAATIEELIKIIDDKCSKPNSRALDPQDSDADSGDSTTEDFEDSEDIKDSL